jgi:1-acyl-sn-glycerol-3-phosphate acyltransferase
VNWIVEVIRKQKGAVGIYPEGQASWDGGSLPLYASTAKLLRLLKAPVLLAKTHGGYLSLPRWTKFRRRGKIVLEFSILFSPEDLKTLAPAVIHERLEAGIFHDETAWEEKNRIVFAHPRRAENLELALFMCPACSSVSAMKSSDTRIFCSSCGFGLEFDEYGRFSPPGELRGKEADRSSSAEGVPATPIPVSVPMWETWQKKAFGEYILRAVAEKDDRPLLEARGVRFSRGWRMEGMTEAGIGRLVLHSDRLDFIPENGAVLSLPVSRIEGPGVLKKNLLEFYVEKSVYRARFPDLSHSGRSWASALEILVRSSAGGV